MPSAIDVFRVSVCLEPRAVERRNFSNLNGRWGDRGGAKAQSVVPDYKRLLERTGDQMDGGDDRLRRS